MNPTPDRHPARRGFTLIELMVSIALVLILILGINQVFRIASDTINAGQALSTADRENRGAQFVLYGDMRNMVTTNGPCIIIRSQQMYAFRNLQDELSDRDFVPGTAMTSTQGKGFISSVDIDSDGTEGEPAVRGERIPPTATNTRSHRIDELMFFANHMFHRQTGAGGRLTSSGSSKEAFVWYGHLQLANNQPTPAYYNPGEADGGTSGSVETGGPAGAGARNDNNRYATQWTLGRVPILLIGDTIDPVNPPPSYLGRAGNNLSPLADMSVVQYSPNERPPAGSPPQIHRSVCDVAQTSIADYRGLLSDRRNWSSGAEWWDTVAKTRFWANPSPLRPLDAAKISRTAPIFVQGCTQFIVEYAGDFLSQVQTPGSTEGRITGHVFSTTGSGDGVTDFVVLNPGTPAAIRRTRWYGMPRNVDTSDDGQTGPGMIRGGNGTSDTNQLIDVDPLRDVLASFGGVGAPSFEPDIDQLLPARANYADGNPVGRYVAAWSPSDLSYGSLRKPTMMRITIVVDDPDGRMTEGQRYEYVFKLP